MSQANATVLHRSISRSKISPSKLDHGFTLAPSEAYKPLPQGNLCASVLPSEPGANILDFSLLTTSDAERILNGAVHKLVLDSEDELNADNLAAILTLIAALNDLRTTSFFALLRGLPSRQSQPQQDSQFKEKQLTELVFRASALRNTWPPSKRDQRTIRAIQISIDQLRADLGYANSGFNPPEAA